MSVCKTCGAEIRWVKSATTGKPMPLDPVAVKGGNVQVLIMPGDTEYTARVLWPDPDRVAHVSHFATCPQADEHRRGDRDRDADTE